MFNFLAAADPMEHVMPHRLFHDGGPWTQWITNQMLMATVAAVLMLLIFPALFNRANAGAPRGARNFFESILEFLRVEVFRPALKEHTDRFLPFLWTLFFFILFCNLLSALPIDAVVSLVTLGRVKHVAGTATGTFSTTAALAASAFIFIHLNGVIQVFRSLRDGTYGHHGHHEEHSADGKHGHEAAHDLDHMRGEALAADVPNNFSGIGDPTHHYADDEHHGSSHAPAHHAEDEEHDGAMPFLFAIFAALPLYLWNFAPHPFRPQPGGSQIGWLADIPVWGMLLVLELIGAVIKPLALAIRLFANMIAGHLVLGVLISMIPFTASILHQVAIGTPVTLLALLISVLELFVAFLQAYIFTFLTTLFIASAVAPEH